MSPNAILSLETTHPLLDLENYPANAPVESELYSARLELLVVWCIGGEPNHNARPFWAEFEEEE